MVTNLITGLVNAAKTLFAPQEVDQAARLAMDWQQLQEGALRTGYDLYSRYYRGEHKAKLPRRLQQFLPADLHFRDNFCALVIAANLDRLSVTGFLSEDEALAAWAQDVWQRNRMDLTQIQAHQEALVKGDAYILVHWDVEASAPLLSFQPADTITVRYDPGNRLPTLAAKKWTSQPTLMDAPITRLNLYYPDRVEKYAARSGVWQPTQDEGDEAWPVPWVDAQGQPLGVPIIHLRNGTGVDSYGQSELDAVIPLQDLLNKQLVDLTMILDTMAFAQRYAIGAALPATLNVLPGTVWNIKTDEPEKVQVGQFPAADVAGPLQAIEMIIQHMAAISRTPQHLLHLTGQYPSGEALKISEAGLVKKVRLQQIAFGNAWEDALYMARKLQARFGPDLIGMGAEDAMIETAWADPESRNEGEHMDSLAVKREKLGIPKVQVWRELGYTEEQIQTMLGDEINERAAETNIGAEVLKRFEGGR